MRHDSGGNHGHRLMDRLGALTIARLYNLVFYPEPDERIDPLLPSGFCHQAYNLPMLRRTVTYKGPFYKGISLEHAQTSFQSKARLFIPTVFSLRKAFRLHPFQAYQWNQNGELTNSVFEQITRQLTQFANDNFNELSWFEGDFHHVAVHISRGSDYDRPEFHLYPERLHYMFPIEFFLNAVNQLREKHNKAILFHIFTEKKNSEEVVTNFEDQPDVKLYLGPNREENNQAYIEKVFQHLVMADSLIACNSQFSLSAAYYRPDRPTYFFPNDHLKGLPADFYRPLQISGEPQ